MFKTKFTLRLLALTILSFSTISQAAFLDEIGGSYKISGNKCKFESTTKLTGNAKINQIDNGATVDLEVIIANLKTTIPYSFKSGNGDVKTTRLEGDIIKLPIVRRTVWSTNEYERKSTITQFEGVAIPRLLYSATLIEKSSRDLVLRIEDRQSTAIECELVRN